MSRLISRPRSLFLSLAGLSICCASSLAQSPITLHHESDGTQIRVDFADFGKIDYHWSTTIHDGLLTWPLISTDTTEHDAAVIQLDQNQVTITMMFPQPRVEMICTATIEEGRKLRQRVGLRNLSKQAIHWLEAEPLHATVSTRAKQPLLTGLHPRTGVITDLAHQQRQAIHEHGSFYDHQGQGFVFGPTGEPISYVEFDWRKSQDLPYLFHAKVPMDRVTIEPGETRWSQEIIVVYDQPAAALQQWAEAIQKSHRARPPQRALHGWNNWNQLQQKNTNEELSDIIQTVTASEQRLRPALVQMDYNYYDPSLSQRLSSPWLSLRQKEIASLGAKFGANIGVGGPSWPGLRDHQEIAQSIARAVYHGIDYFKVFYPADRSQSDGKRTAFEIYRDHWRVIREAAGDDCYLLFCDYEPNRAAIGYVDASRVGPDAQRGNIRPAIMPLLRSFALHNRWFTIDADTYFTGTDIANISQVDGSWPLVRTWLSMVGLSCGTAITSDPWYWSDFQPYWRNVEILSPPARERTEVLDIGKATEWPRLMSKIERPWGKTHVALLWNPLDKEQTVSLDFAASGLKSDQRYAVWSFWDDRYLGVADSTWTSPRLGPYASQHLCLTPLPNQPTTPILIGSNLHIFCGAAEVKNFEAKRARCHVTLNDAGARDGAIFLYSRWQPILDSARGCKVSGITSAGENVWRVSLYDRVMGKDQHIEMRILLPLYYQPWFWALITIVIISLALSTWNYLHRLQHERARALDLERARIARDIHDDLGASLTHIALLGELAQHDIDRPDMARAHVDDIFRAAKKLTSSVDEIVWALNPANDTVDHFAAYIGDYAQEFLHSAHLDCRLFIPNDLPPRPLLPQTRHGLFLIIKEVLHNIISHAQANRVSLQIDCDSQKISIEITDDGRGFDPTAPQPSRSGGGHGLANIRQRVIDMEGTLDIHSKIGHGCKVLIQVPLHSNRRSLP